MVEAKLGSSESALEFFALLMGRENVIDPKTQPEKMENYTKDLADYPSEPFLVLQPNSVEEVSQILSYAKKTKTAVVARGAGTSLTGASSSHGGLVVDFSKNMNRILKVDLVNWYVHCQAGVVLEDLNEMLQKKGFFFPPDPSSAPWATVGGVVAENSGGMKCFRYGTVKDWVYALKVVLSDGTIAKLGEPLPKNRVGYDLVHLLCGSEGTLAVITEAWLKIIPRPAGITQRKRMLIFFDDLSGVGKTIQKIRENRIQPTLLEFLDLETVHAVNMAFEEMNLPEHEATLLIEADSQIETIIELSKQSGSSGHYLAQDAADEERLYNARAMVYLGIRAIGLSFFTEDVVVPLDKLSEYLSLVRQISKKFNIRIPVGGHAGDGNLHPIILYDKASEESARAAMLAFGEICSYAIQVGGSVTGEHGIGEQKIGFALEQLKAHGAGNSVELMKKIKAEWDPENILNPGKFLLP